MLTVRRADLAQDRVRGVNRLWDMLAGIFPALEAALDYSTPEPLILLTAFQAPAHLRAAGQEGMAGHLTAHGLRTTIVANVTGNALKAAAEQTVALSAEAATTPLIARRARRLPDLDREIKDLAEQITHTFREHPRAEIIESLPGLGPIPGAKLLAATGGDLAAFGTPSRLAAFAGLAPASRDSGRIQNNLHRPQRYHRGLRRVFYRAALCSSMHNELSKTFYRRKRTEGKHHSQAPIALPRRLIDILWALPRDNRPFTPTPPQATQTTAAT